MKIGIVGDGHVGSALQRGLERAGHQTRAVGKDPKGVREVGAFGEVLILAVPWPAQEDALRELGENANGKVLVDVSNALTADMQLALGHTTSAAEELQKKARGTKVVKAFNTVFAQTMDSGRAKDQQISAFIAGDDEAAKGKVLQLARDIGFDAVDAGPLKNARWIEALGYLNIQLGYVQKLGTQIGIRLVR